MKPEKKAALKKFFTEKVPAVAIFLISPTLLLLNHLATADDRADQKAILAAQAEAERAALLAQADCTFTYKGKDYRTAAAQPDRDWPAVNVLGPTFVRGEDGTWKETKVDRIYAEFQNETDKINALRMVISAMPACEP